METRTLEIDLGVKCPKCGKTGATRVEGSEKVGMCLNCALKNLEKKIKDQQRARGE